MRNRDDLGALSCRCDSSHEARSAASYAKNDDKVSRTHAPATAARIPHKGRLLRLVEERYLWYDAARPIFQLKRLAVIPKVSLFGKLKSYAAASQGVDDSSISHPLTRYYFARRNGKWSLPRQQLLAFRNGRHCKTVPLQYRSRN